jgi:hypothetical protein
MRLRGAKRRLWALWTLLIIVAAATAGGFAGPLPAHAAARPGTIEICKSAANGMTGRSFSFTWTDHTGAGGTVSVVGGGCSAAITVAGGQVTVTEGATAGTVVQKITLSPTGRKVSLSPSTGTAIVRAPAGGTETVITYVNKMQAAQLKICKQAASNSTQLIGEPFSFSENGGPAFTVHAGAFGSPHCSALTAYAAGTDVSVAELQPASNVSVSEIDVTQPPATNVTTNLSARTASLTLGSGVNIVTFTNQINVSAQTGYVEICKYATDQFVSGYFSFLITDAAGLTYGPYTVLLNQCTTSIQVTSGPATITETPEFPYYLGEFSASPPSRWISDNLINQSATVEVVAGDQTTETVAYFLNSTLLAQVKICKALDSANSDALAGSVFSFSYTDAAGQGTTSIVANTFANGPACVFIPTPNNAGLPLGSAVSITEVGEPNVALLTVGVSPSAADNGSTTTTADLLVQAGITTATFTNRAEGTLEICKNAADPQTLGKGSNPFNFVVNGSIDVTVNAGQCSFAIGVPAGTATVDELPSANFHLVSVTAAGPTGDNRLLSGSNPVTVSVPFGGVGNETLVTYTNAVNTGQFKICKTTSEPQIIGGVTFTFAWSYTVDGATTSGTVGLTPGECSGLLATIPVVDSSGDPVSVTVGEASTPLVFVNTITYAGNGSLVSSSTATGWSSFDIGIGVNSITYDNEVTPF